MWLLRGVIFCLCCVVFSPENVAATDQSLEDFLAGVEAQAAQVHALRCSFIQEKHLAVFAQPVIFNGVLNLVRPDNLRWELVAPVPSVFILKGQKGIRCTDQQPPQYFDLKDDPVMQMVASQLWTWLDGKYGQLNQSYQLAMAGSSSLSIIPKDDKVVAEFIESINIVFDPVSKQPQQVEIFEPGGDLTRIVFHGYQLDHLPDEALFARCYRGE
ncbi:MAG: outer membrane lipoprotein carrier protein LolA [Desulfobulbaceae bacterium]|nr:outer membrane lipoprotein carrier protein LolA [Desulfobulbaceae bacterium]HIJ78976.1 outer membrane lipoprotein carrier protein LolA [Deltaproteobacteria bacterium]